MNRHSIDIGIIHKPHHLVGEEVGIVLGVEVRFGGLGGVELKTFADTFAQDVDGRVGFHDLVHGLEV